jgi:hypothetical protein
LRKIAADIWLNVEEFLRHRMRLPNLIRWLLVVPSAVAAWYFALLVGALVFAVVVAPCSDSDEPPPRFCEAPWFPLVRPLVIPLGVALAAILVVTVPAIVAPSHRVGVAWTAFAAGAIVAGVMGYQAGAIAEVAVALAAGFLAAVFVSRFARGSSNRRFARTDGVPSAPR